MRQRSQRRGPTLGRSPGRRHGITLVELLVVTAVIGILTTIAALNLVDLNQDAVNATSQTSALLHNARMHAVSTLGATRVTSPDGRRLLAEQARRCTDTTWTTVPGLEVTLPAATEVDTTGELACFTSRGLAARHSLLRLTDRRGRTGTVEVLLGGAIRSAQ